MEKIKVKFYDTIDDSLLKFAVIVSKYQNNWVFCKHRERTTYEIPGGHREKDETPLQAAERELKEETGALTYDISPICVYSVINDGEESFGMLYFAEIHSFEKELTGEIESIHFFEKMPESLTYPLIQPKLFEEVIRRKELK